MKQLFFLLISSLFFFNAVQAQDSCSKWALGLDLDVVIPYAELADKGHFYNVGVNVDLFYKGFEKEELKFHPGFRLRVGGSPMNSRIELLPEPLNEEATHGVYNLLVDTKIAGRLLLKSYRMLIPYVEGDMGVRFSGAYDKYTPLDEFSDVGEYSENIVKEFSGTYGAGVGFLCQIAPGVSVNVSTNLDWTNSMEYVNFNTAFPFDSELTRNGFDQRFAIGILADFGCGKNDDERREVRQEDRSTTTRKRGKKPNISTPDRNKSEN